MNLLAKLINPRRNVNEPMRSTPPESHRLTVPLDTTYFHVTHWKAGSQWMRGVLEDIFGQAVVPAEHYNQQIFGRPIFNKKIYTCVYLGKPEFDSLAIPGKSRRLVMIRDLRDTLVSLYFSCRYSHVLDHPGMKACRHTLTNISKEDGISHLMETHLCQSANIQRTWLLSKENVYRLEDLMSGDPGYMREMLESAYDLQIEKTRCETIMESHSFEKLASRERGQEDVNAHYRKGIHGDWKNHFTPGIKDRFKYLYNDLLLKAGYEKDSAW